ncbi:MAG: hypothetical protein QUT30_14020 [Acidobacteriota bacterium]|jgi:hypothetical protein|nr:hypothetical protein [Acidobacteriota bacterium]
MSSLYGTGKYWGLIIVGAILAATSVGCGRLGGSAGHGPHVTVLDP